MRVHIIDHNTVHLPLISKLVAESIKDLEAVTIAETGDAHKDYIKAADLIIISGGSRLVHLNPNLHRRLVKHVLDADKPVFGICLGAEAIAAYFGATLSEMPERVSGVSATQLVNPILVEQYGDNVNVFKHHKWSINHLPKDLIADAQTEAGVDLFHHKTLPVWGSQFHPEAKRGGNKGYRLFRQALRQMGIDVRGIRRPQA